MSLIFYIVILFFLFGLINNYSKFIIIACSWSLFLRMLCIGNLSLFGIIIILAIVIGVLRYRDDFYNTEKYPFILCSLLFMSSIVFTNYFSSDKHWGISIIFSYVFCLCKNFIINTWSTYCVSYLIIVILIKLCHYSKDKLYQYD